MIREIYYFFSRKFYNISIKQLASNVQLHLKGRVIHGEYVKMDKNVILGENWLIAVYPEFAGKINPVKNRKYGVEIEEGVSVNRNMTIYCADHVRIGKNCMLGSNILITDNDHGMTADAESYSQQELIARETVVEEECWIGQNCTILAGCHIGKRSILGAGSVVKGTIPPYSMVAGVPGRVVKTWDFEKHEWRKVNDENTRK